MSWLTPKNEALYEIVFRDRNREYGSYMLRKRYRVILAWSTLWGTILVLLIVFIPFLTYLLEEARGLADDDFIYEVEYMPMSPPEADNMQELARAMTRAPEERVQAPVVTDSVIPEKEPPPAEPEEKEEQPDADSVGEPGGVKDGTGTGDASGLATVIDVYPRYPGGDDARLLFLKRNVRYPQDALRSGVQGVVVVVFIIEPDGTLTGVKIEKGIGAGCDEEAARVVGLMPKWEPGRRQGKAVRVMVRMPVVFRIPGRKT